MLGGLIADICSELSDSEDEIPQPKAKKAKK
jgi:hypothetical protein